MPNLIPQGVIVLGILTVIGFIKAMGHVIDAVTDPLIAAKSDRSQNRNGRRIPMMKWAAVPFGACALLIFCVPFSESGIGNAVWIAVFMWGYYLFYTIYMIPHTALIPEMVQNENQRVNTYTWSSFFFVAGSAAGYAAPALVRIWKGYGLNAVSSWRSTFAAYTVIGIFLTKQVKTPAVRMAGLITEIEKKQPFLRKMYPELLAMFESLAPYMNLPMRLVFANMWCFGGLLKRLIPALNAQAGDYTAEVFFRCVKEEDLQSDLEVFRKLAAEYEIEIEEVLEDEYHRPASLTSGGYRFIKSCVEEQFNYAACASFILPAGTDARHFSDLSDAVIRFAPIDINNQQYASVHNKNENIGMDAVARAVEFYKNLLKKM